VGALESAWTLERRKISAPLKRDGLRNEEVRTIITFYKLEEDLDK
jgi:hypothetical protein